MRSPGRARRRSPRPTRRPGRIDGGSGLRVPREALARVLSSEDEPDALALVAEVELPPAALLAVGLGLGVGQDLEARPVEALVGLGAEHHADLDVLLRLERDLPGAVVDAGVRVEAVRDVSVEVRGAARLRRVTVRAVLEAAVERAGADEAQGGLADARAHLI